MFTGPPPPAELVVAVGPVGRDEVLPTAMVIAFLDPLGRPAEMARLAHAGITAMAMELIPRTTQAQAMDALSSQATAAGYQAVLLAATRLPRFLPMLMTAAGTVPPARVLVIGAGVAGLQAIATARRLGAVVAGYDIRPAAAEQVQSLGAATWAARSSRPPRRPEATPGRWASAPAPASWPPWPPTWPRPTSSSPPPRSPGKPAPRLITRAMVEAMKPGSVVVDLTASAGGNCEATVPDQEVDLEGVLVLGPRNLATGTAGHASEMYSRNVTALIRHLAPDGSPVIDLADPITAAACVTHGGVILNPVVRAALGGGA